TEAPWKSVRPFKVIFCHGLSEFESYMPMQSRLCAQAKHLAAGQVLGQTVHIEFLAEVVDQLRALAIVEPGILLTGVEPERGGAEQRPGSDPSRYSNNWPYGPSRRCRFARSRALAMQARSRPRRRSGSGICRRSPRKRI